MDKKKKIEERIVQNVPQRRMVCETRIGDLIVVVVAAHYALSNLNAWPVSPSWIGDVPLCITRMYIRVFGVDYIGKIW